MAQSTGGYFSPAISFLAILIASTISASALYEGEPKQLVHGMNLLCFRSDQSKIDSKYALFLFRSQGFRSQLGKSIKKAVNQASISIKDLKSILVPLPPLDEQRRIAAILDAADSLRAKRRAALAKLDQLAQSIFIEMFGDLSTNSMDWPKRPLSEACEITSSLVDPTHPAYADLLHFGPDRIERATGRLLAAKTACEDGVKSGKFLFDRDSILYSKIRPYLNKVALAERPGLCSADVYPVQPKRGATRREFLWTILRSGDFLTYANSFSNRANIPKLNRDQFMNYEMICPPIELQERFVTRRMTLAATEQRARDSLGKFDALFGSLQHRAFRGEL